MTGRCEPESVRRCAPKSLTDCLYCRDRADTDVKLVKPNETIVLTQLTVGPIVCWIRAFHCLYCMLDASGCHHHRLHIISILGLRTSRHWSSYWVPLRRDSYRYWIRLLASIRLLQSSAALHGLVQWIAIMFGLNVQHSSGVRMKCLELHRCLTTPKDSGPIIPAHRFNFNVSSMIMYSLHIQQLYIILWNVITKIYCLINAINSKHWLVARFVHLTRTPAAENNEKVKLTTNCFYDVINFAKHICNYRY